MVTIEPSPRVILQATQVIPHGFSPESSPSSRQPLNLQNRFKARIFPRTLGVDGHVKAAECFLPVWGGATEETLEWHGVAPIKWLKIDGATGVITLWFLSGRESTLKGIEIWTRNTKTWEAPFFLPKEEQTFEAYFPLGKANMSPENQWLEDVFPIEIRSPFLGDVLVFGGLYFSTGSKLMVCLPSFGSSTWSTSHKLIVIMFWCRTYHTLMHWNWIAPSTFEMLPTTKCRRLLPQDALKLHIAS